DAGALAAASERGHGELREVAHPGLVTVGDRLADHFGQLVAVDPLALAGLAGLDLIAVALGLAGSFAVDRLELGGAEEPAVEDALEQVAVLLRLRQGRGQRLAEL